MRLRWKSAGGVDWGNSRIAVQQCKRVCLLRNRQAKRQIQLGLRKTHNPNRMLKSERIRWESTLLALLLLLFSKSHRLRKPVLLLQMPLKPANTLVLHLKTRTQNRERPLLSGHHGLSVKREALNYRARVADFLSLECSIHLLLQMCQCADVLL